MCIRDSYYFRVIKVMFLGEPCPPLEIPSGTPLRTTLLVSCAGVLLLGVYPYALMQVLDWTRSMIL